MPFWFFVVCFIFFSFHARAEELPQKAQEKLEAAADQPAKFIWVPIVYYTPETSLAAGLLGVQNFNKAAPGKISHLILIGSETAAGQSIASISPHFYLQEGHYELGGVLSASYFPDQYYGIGLNNTLSTPEDYTATNSMAGVNGGVNVYSQLYLRGGTYYNKRVLSNLDPGGRLLQDISAYSTSYQVLSNAASVEWDTRNFPQAPTDGALYKFETTFYTPRDLVHGEAMGSFQKYELDLRQYVSLTPRLVWATQWLNSAIEGTTIIPFDYLNTIGGGNRLRGYYAGRFREKSLSLLQTETRYQWDDKWILASFVGAARLGPEFSELNNPDDSRLFATAGGGVRYVLEPENQLHLRFDVGFGAGSPEVYFVLGEAF